MTVSPVKVGLLFVSLKKALFCPMTNVTGLTNRQRPDFVIRPSPPHVTGVGIRQNGARFSMFFLCCIKPLFLVGNIGRLKTEPFDVLYGTSSSNRRHEALLIRLRRTPLYKSAFDLIERR